MSGGHFNYDQYLICQIAEDIRAVIRHNGSDDVDDYGDRRSHDLPPDIIEEFKRAVQLLDQAYVYAQRIDWLLSGDDGEESFRRRLKADLEALRAKLGGDV